MSRRLLSRRHVLRGIGSTAVALPLLEAMGCSKPDGEVVAAKSAALDPGGELAPKRFFLYVTGNGGVMDDYFPTRRSNTDFDLGPSMQLEDFALASRTVTEFRDRLLLVDGIDNLSKPGSHEAHGALTTCRGIDDNDLGLGRSIDRVIGDYIRANDPNAPADLILNTATKSVGTVDPNNPDFNFGKGKLRWLSYESASTPAAQNGNPVELFDRMFAAATDPAAAEAAAMRRAQEASLLDSVLEDYGSLHRRLGANDKLRLDEHMQRIRDVELKLRAPTRSCSSADPVPEFDQQAGESRGLPEATARMFHVIELAFACDLTRVATFMSRTEGETRNHTFPWLSFGYCSDPTHASDCYDDTQSESDNVAHHPMSHHQSKHRDNLNEVMQWQVSQLTGFAGRLADVSEGTGSLLDSSLCLHTSGNSSTHSARRLPLLGIGSLGGALRTGQALEFQGRSLNDFWLTVLNAFGSDASSFGAEEFVTGPIADMLA